MEVHGYCGPRDDQVAAPRRRLRAPQLLALELGAATGRRGGSRRSGEDDVNGGRSLGFLDHFALWASLGASLYLMPFGALLVPALSIEQALLATVVAGLLGGLLIASIGAIASHTRRST